MPSGESVASLRVVILGSDALLEARPATPIQLARACLAAGYDFVAPVSWGEELLASRVLESVRDIAPPSSVVVHCPFVAEAIRQQNDVLPACWRSVSPPVATARYVRAAFSGRAVHVSYAGRCPGATTPDLDAVILPQVLYGQLLDAGAIPLEQPKYFEEMLPPDRARYASLPGGVPEPAVLHAAAGARLREAAAATLRAVAMSLESAEPVVIDLENASGCVCARDRFAIAQLEPPRATSPVVSTSIVVDLALRVEPRSREVPVMTRPPAPREQERPSADASDSPQPRERLIGRIVEPQTVAWQIVERRIVEESEAATLVSAMEPWGSPAAPAESAPNARGRTDRPSPVDRTVDREAVRPEPVAKSPPPQVASPEPPPPSAGAIDPDDWFAPEPDPDAPVRDTEPAR